MFFGLIHAKIYVMKIKEILEYGKKNLIKENGYMLSKTLLKHLLNVNDTYILINSDEELEKNIEEKFIESIEFLKCGTPLQYITNIQEFMGLNFYVDKNVLIPQPDTEILVEEVMNLCKEKNEILDLCTGSGAIGISLAKYTNSTVTMTDISKKALDIANRNSVGNGVSAKCKFILSNMFENVQEKFDIIVSNPPYIKTEVIKSLDLEVQNEPNIALDGGKDGLEFYKIITENAYKYLKPKGILALEIGYDQKEEVINLLKFTNKYENIYSKKDLAGNNRIIVCNII